MEKIIIIILKLGQFVSIEIELKKMKIASISFRWCHVTRIKFFFKHKKEIIFHFIKAITKLFIAFWVIGNFLLLISSLSLLFESIFDFIMSIIFAIAKKNKNKEIVDIKMS